MKFQGINRKTSPSKLKFQKHTVPTFYGLKNSYVFENQFNKLLFSNFPKGFCKMFNQTPGPQFNHRMLTYLPNIFHGIFFSVSLVENIDSVKSFKIYLQTTFEYACVYKTPFVSKTWVNCSLLLGPVLSQGVDISAYLQGVGGYQWKLKSYFPVSAGR